VTFEPFRIVVVDPLPERFSELFRVQLPPERFSFDCPESADSEELSALVRGARALVTRHHFVDSELIAEAGETLQLIQVMGRFPDRVDLAAAEKAGVPVAVMPHGGAIAVAEHTLALMLALVRKIVPGHTGVVDGGYQTRDLEPTPTTEWQFAFNWLGFKDVIELRGKTLGLIGLGEIGREVARRAKSFDMTILYHQRRRIPARYEQILGVRKARMEELLRDSDIVSLHAPHTAETENILSRRRLELMKPTALVINTARGGLVDEEALVERLEKRKLAGAGLDVFVEEPLPFDHPLIGLDNVVLAPHTGGGSGGGQKKLIGQVIENIARVEKGEAPINQVKHS
jgi:phosphoglycerate dehydrogenase-like enzyme